MLFCTLIALLLVLVFYVLNFFLRLKFFSEVKISPFERGFESIGKIHSSFRIHFFIIILIFVIFDLEVVILMGFLVSDLRFYLNFILILTFVLGGFYMEWFFGKLVWIV